MSDWASAKGELVSRIGEIEFSRKSPTAADMRRVGGIVESDATILIDADGRIEGVLPHSRLLVGKRIDYRYGHLKAALNGEPTVSDVVLSEVDRKPVVSIAAPVDTPYGRRVLNAGFDVDGPALQSLVKNMTTIENSNFELIDSAGHPVVETEQNVTEPIDSGVIASSLGANRQASTGIEDGNFYSLAPVAGTPWTLALTIPESSLYSSIAPPWLQWAVIAVFAGVLLLVALLFEVVLSSRRRVRLIANLDSLTRLPNRAFTTRSLCNAMADRVPEEPLSILLIDVDHFKQINDRFGHAAGDRVLATLASRMQNALRPEDVIGRWGGEEFLAILHDTRLPAAQRVAERLREMIESEPVVFKEMSLDVSISVGCVQVSSETLDQVVDRADLAMYEAKRSGRNVVVAA